MNTRKHFSFVALVVLSALFFVSCRGTRGPYAALLKDGVYVVNELIITQIDSLVSPDSINRLKPLENLGFLKTNQNLLGDEETYRLLGVTPNYQVGNGKVVTSILNDGLLKLTYFIFDEQSPIINTNCPNDTGALACSFALPTSGLSNIPPYLLQFGSQLLTPEGHTAYLKNALDSVQENGQWEIRGLTKMYMNAPTFLDGEFNLRFVKGIKEIEMTSDNNIFTVPGSDIKGPVHMKLRLTRF